MRNMFKNCIFKLLYLFQTCDKKTACKKYEKYKSYDYFKKAYKYDAEHDVAKNVTILMIFNVNTECFSQNKCFKVIFKTLQLY